MNAKIGPREAALREMRERRFSRGRPIEATTRTLLAGIPPRSRRDTASARESNEAEPKQETDDMAKKRKAGPKAKAKRAKKPRAKAKPAGRKKRVAKVAAAPKAARKPREGAVSAQEVADFIARPNGASMEELVAKFGIEAHPMRAKIHYVRHKLGYDVENKGGRYYGTPPKQAQAAE